jgi:hypothetical protein
MAKIYIVYRETQDNGPMGSVRNYVKVTNPGPHERIYHGKFVAQRIDCGQYDADSMTVMVPVGEITSEIFGESADAGAETF